MSVQKNEYFAVGFSHYSDSTITQQTNSISLSLKCLKLIFTQFLAECFSILSAHSVKTIFLGLEIISSQPKFKNLFFVMDSIKRQNDKNFQSRFFAILFPNFDFLKIIKVGLLFSLSRPAPPQMTGQKSSSRFPSRLSKQNQRLFRRAFQPKFLWQNLSANFFDSSRLLKQTFSFVLIISFSFLFLRFVSQKRQVVFNRFP